MPTTWRYVGAAVRGTSHEKRNMPCQDAFQIEFWPNMGLAIAVSDGAGSASQAEKGAQFITDKALTILYQQWQIAAPQDEVSWKAMLRHVFAQTRIALARQAWIEHQSLTNFAATLTLIILTDTWTIGAMIGDCVAVVLNKQHELHTLCPPQRGEYPNTTYFLTQDSALTYLDYYICPEPSCSVALLSDGLLPLALNLAHNRPYAPFFTPLFTFVADMQNKQKAQQQLVAFLNSQRVNARTDDDKTLVLASRELD